MKKDPTRDYAVAAFRLYASMGRQGYEVARKRIFNTEQARHENPEKAYTQAERATTNATPLLMDILAVEKTLDLLTRGDKSYIVKAVEAVYFTAPAQPLHKGDISARVCEFSLSLPVDESSVLRWLSEARRLFAAVRGLRIEKETFRRYGIDA